MDTNVNRDVGAKSIDSVQGVGNVDFDGSLNVSEDANVMGDVAEGGQATVDLLNVNSSMIMSEYLLAILTIKESNQICTSTLASFSDTSPTVADIMLTEDSGAGSSLRIKLVNTSSWKGGQMFRSVAVNGGTIYSTTSGGTSQSNDAFTTLNFNSTSTFDYGIEANNVTVGLGTGSFFVADSSTYNAPIPFLTISGLNQICTSTPASFAVQVSWK